MFCKVYLAYHTVPSPFPYFPIRHLLDARDHPVTFLSFAVLSG